MLDTNLRLPLNNWSEGMWLDNMITYYFLFESLFYETEGLWRRMLGFSVHTQCVDMVGHSQLIFPIMMCALLIPGWTSGKSHKWVTYLEENFISYVSCSRIQQYNIILWKTIWGFLFYQVWGIMLGLVCLWMVSRARTRSEWVVWMLSLLEREKKNMMQ